METNNKALQSNPQIEKLTLNGVEFDAVRHEINSLSDLIGITEGDEDSSLRDGRNSDTINLSFYNDTTIIIYKVTSNNFPMPISDYPYSVYEINNTIDLDGKILIMPKKSILKFGNTGKLTNGTVLSNHTIVVNMGDATSDNRGGLYLNDHQVGKVDIIGKIFNELNQEITVKGDVIPDDSTPLLYNYIPHSIVRDQYDCRFINQLNRRARNVGLTECILMLTCIGDNYNNGKVIGGGDWDTTNNSPEYMANEIFLNRLKVRAVKFHSKYWHGPIGDYFQFIYNYVGLLNAKLKTLNSTNPDYTVDLFKEVYIINERPDWTDQYCSVVPNIINNLPQTDIIPIDENIPDFFGFTWHISYAGINQMLVSDPSFYNKIYPGLNFYPRMTRRTINPEWDDAQLDTFIHKYGLVEQVMEHFTSIDSIWDGTHSFDGGIPISEVGCCPNQRALIAPSADPGSTIGSFQENIMPLYWKVIGSVANRLKFKYIVVFFHNWIYDNSYDVDNTLLDSGNPYIVRQNANLVARMYKVFKDFRNSNNQLL